jgi:glucose/arabinose dehydrogenase
MSRRALLTLPVLAPALISALVLAAPGSSRATELRLVPVGNFESPIYVAAPKSEPRALYVVEQAGRIQRVVGGRTTLFFDISRFVTAGGEQGLLSVAFHPRYARNRLFYVDYTALNGNTVIAEYRATARGAVRTRKLADFADPASNHNGGQLQFGPDGWLWWGNGDGGGGGDTYENGQRATGNFAKIKRLDVNKPKARWVTWAVGLRNPWRFSFDRVTGALFIGDVGQNAYEEIDYVPKGRSHLNFGWNRFEGFERYGDQTLLPGWRLTQPIVVYSHDEGCSVTGGYVYRGKQIPAAVGRYFYGDYCSGTIWSFKVAGGKAQDLRTEPFAVQGLASFGEDAAGELYVASDRGTVYKLAG